jgi:hypothetical protein
MSNNASINLETGLVKNYNYNMGYRQMPLTVLGFYTFAGSWVISVSTWQMRLTRARAMLKKTLLWEIKKALVFCFHICSDFL